MTLLTVVLTLVVVGLLLWALNTYVPLESKIKQIINTVVIVVVVLWLLSVAGIINIPIGIRFG